ncbi:MAG: Sortase family protein [Marmoricola sp.]|nr:Sortase family protein [Marmoricola sp.]
MALRTKRPVSLSVLLAAVAVLVGLPFWSGLPAAEAATRVSTSHCRSIDPNLVRGACLAYSSGSATSYTFIGSFRAANGRVFFCIDYLYDSRIAGTPTIIGTHPLVNQLGQRIGPHEVAALNYIVSTWAAHGSTGSADRDAAIALTIRELMSDGVRPGGEVIYPRGLKVGDRVRPPIGGLTGPVLGLANAMWAEASRYYGSYRLRLTSDQTGSLPLGRSRTYRAAVLSGADRSVPGTRMTFRCTGPISCPKPVTTRTSPVPVTVTPRTIGSFTIRATASGPAADGRLYRVGSWHVHGGGTAAGDGIQRGWIAERANASAQVSATAKIVKGTPKITTTTSAATTAPGALLHDVVAVTGLPAGSVQHATATLYGPFTAQPASQDCIPAAQVGAVTFPVAADGTLETPSVRIEHPGYYVWTEILPGDSLTNPVSTPCGVVEETTVLRPSVPTVRTTASTQRALVGDRVHDTVHVSGLAEGSSVPVSWRLLGTLAPRGSSCAGVDWSRARVVDRGTLVADRNGSFVTSATVLRTAGCLTYAEHLAATDTTAAVDTTPGAVEETVLATRPPTPLVPEIPSGPFHAGATTPAGSPWFGRRGDGAAAGTGALGLLALALASARARRRRHLGRHR